MISICRVVLDTLEQKFLNYFFDSILNRTSLVKEVLLAKADAPESYFEEWTENDIKFCKFGYKQIDYKGFHYNGTQHALELHECISKSTQPYIMLTDPDIFFYEGLDEFYLNLIGKYDLDIIGCSHYNPTGWAVTFFPNQVNLIVKRDKLPDSNFLKGELKIRNYQIEGAMKEKPIEACLDGKYLIPGCIPSIAGTFPNPNGLFETGCNLWYWNKINNWKWLSFQTTDCYSYGSLYNRGSKIEKLKKRNLIYHCGMACVALDDQRYTNFKNAFNESKEL